ncbi:MAG: ABC transporter permease [bacterium]|nr:ABC transporter permease [bacterium]
MLENLKQLLTLAVRALLSNKTRSFLTMLGIIIGVGAVVMIMALGAGAQSLILGQLDGFGSDLIGVLPGQSDEKGPPASAFGVTITTLKKSDADALREPRNVPHAQYVAAIYDASVSLSWRDQSYDTNLQGASGDYLEIDGGEIEFGRFFTKEELDSNLRLVVLGSTVAEELFGENNPIGQRIRVKNQTVSVIGVMKERGQVAFQDNDDIVISPLLFAQREIAGVNYLSSISIKVNSPENIDESMEMIRMTLRERHDIDSPADDDFSVRSIQDALDLVTSITDALRYFLAAMAALSLLVGGIGIMNIMLVGVTERTREIGLRKAIGATRRQVLTQFLLEAIALTLFGGIIGLISGAAFSYLVAIIVRSLDYRWDFVISAYSIIIAVGLSTLIGVIFGYYPAWRASRLSPIEALRYE